MERAYDGIIVGGGLLGKATAFALAEAGYQIACIYPQVEEGQASAAAGGMLGVFSEVGAHEPPDRRRLDVSQRWAARQDYAAWISRLSEYSGCPILLRDGLFVIANAAGDDDGAELQAIREATAWHGRPVEMVASREVPGLAPQRGNHPFEAIFLPDEGSVDTAQLLHALEVALARHPAITVYDECVDTVVLADETSVTVELASATLRAPAIVLATGAATTALLATSGLGMLAVPPLFGGRGVSLVVRTACHFPHAVRTPNRSFACGLHVVPRAGERQVYLGATNRLSTTPEYDRSATLGEINTLLHGSIRELNERFSAAELLRIAVGYRPVAIDKLPVVGRTKDPRVLIASGTYRNGILLAPLIASLIADEFAAPGVHASHPFSPLRAMLASGRASLGAWLRDASQRLLTTVAEPGGSLPNGREHDVAALFYTTFSMLLDPEFDARELRTRAQRLLQRAPIEESIPSLLDLIARQASRARPPS